MSAVERVTLDRAIADARAVLDAIDDDPMAASGPKVCVGYCMGARISLHAAAALSEELVAAAGSHPAALVTDAPDSPHNALADVRGELYFAFAENDPSAPVETVERFRAELERLHVRGADAGCTPWVRDGGSAGLQLVGGRGALRASIELWRRNLAPQPVTRS